MFGKTLNLSMLKYFYEITNKSNDHLFAHTAIKKYIDYNKLQGQFPVIFLTFKDIKQDSWENTYNSMAIKISDEFKRHKEVLWSQLDDQDRLRYMSIISMNSSIAILEDSLLFLSRLLNKHYEKKVIFLLDEYDSPIHAGYEHNYYKKITAFMASLLSSVLKDNDNLQRGILTGILRTAKEGIFSGLNNLIVGSVIDIKFQDKFGFTRVEIEAMLLEYEFINLLPEFQEWYNGYTFGENTIYNPWSVLNCIDSRGILKPYWVNTSNNRMVKKLLAIAGSGFKSDFESLISDKSVIKPIDDGLVFPGIENNEDALWSLLLYTGYLTYDKQTIEEGKVYCNLVIPNKEIKVLFKDLLNQILFETLSVEKIKMLTSALTNGDTESFSTLLREFILNSISSYDLPSNEPEKSYHLFILGLLSYLSGSYEIKSNRESGYGRYDIMIIPKNSDKLAIIIEFKKAMNNETLQSAAQNALEQIKTKQYAHELFSRSIKNIQLLGIALHGKEIYTISEFI